MLLFIFVTITNTFWYRWNDMYPDYIVWKVISEPIKLYELNNTDKHFSWCGFIVDTVYALDNWWNLTSKSTKKIFKKVNICEDAPYNKWDIVLFEMNFTSVDDPSLIKEYLWRNILISEPIWFTHNSFENAYKIECLDNIFYVTKTFIDFENFNTETIEKKLSLNYKTCQNFSNTFWISDTESKKETWLKIFINLWKNLQESKLKFFLI